MKIGCPKEIKNHEYRVAIPPSLAASLVAMGHEVAIEAGAGIGSGFENAEYEKAGAKLMATPQEVFDWAEMIVKVKEPQSSELAMLRKGQILFTYLHLAADKALTEALLESGVTGIAYETITSEKGDLPLLTPMSEVAGRLAPQMGAWALQKANGGRGVLMGGVAGVHSAQVAIIGGGVVGTEAARVANGMGARVTIFDRSVSRLKALDEMFMGAVETQYSTPHAIETMLKTVDMVIGAVLVPGAAAPKLVSKAQLSLMPKGSVLVDVAIDQGGCFETSRATTHQDPIYIVDDIVHYCVANMPGAAARTATLALTNATSKYVIELANKGWTSALKDNPYWQGGLNVHEGKLTYKAVADDLNLPYTPIETVLA